MPAPLTLPRVDSNGSNQPATFPASIENDGYQEKAVVPNSYWNYLFRLIYLWLAYLQGGSTILDAFTEERGNNNLPSVAATEEAIRSYTLAADTFPAAGANAEIIIKGTYHLNVKGSMTSTRLRIRVGTTPLAGAEILDFTFTPSTILSGFSFEVSLAGTNDGGGNLLGTARSRVESFDGPSTVTLERAATVLYAPSTGSGDFDLAVNSNNFIEVTLDVDNLTSMEARLVDFSITSAVMPA